MACSGYSVAANPGQVVKSFSLPLGKLTCSRRGDVEGQPANVRAEQGRPGVRASRDALPGLGKLGPQTCDVLLHRGTFDCQISHSILKQFSSKQ